MDWKERLKQTGSNVIDKYQKAKAENEEYKKKNATDSILRVSRNEVFGVKVETVRKDKDGLFYISGRYDETAPRYTFENLEFSGSKIITKTETKTKGKQKGRAGSALVGGALLGPVGAVAGASRGKKHSSRSDSVSKQEEKPGKGSIYLRSIDTNEITEVKFHATEAEFSNIERFFN